MSSTDPIADMFTRIRNANLVNRDFINLPHSKIKEEVAKILVKNGYLVSTSAKKDGHTKNMEIILKLTEASSSITHIKKVSTPGRRLYVKRETIPKVKRGRGIVILSTSKGIMTGEEARSKKIGGELLAEIY